MDDDKIIQKLRMHTNIGTTKEPAKVDINFPNLKGKTIYQNSVVDNSQHFLKLEI